MTLWFVLAMMTGAAVFAVLWPLGRRAEGLSSGHDVRVYRDQLDEITRDRAAGRIGAAEAEAARIEVSRRLLAAAEQESAAPVTSASRKRAVALAALVLLPLLSGGLYLALGSPSLPAQPLSAGVTPQATPPIEQLVAQVEAHLERNPQDGRGWEVVAPVYMQLRRYEDAARARRNAITYNGATAKREADLGEALVASANGIVTAEAKQAFERALALDNTEAKARYFLGLSAKQDGRTAVAAAMWRDLLASAPPGASWAVFVRDELAQIEQAPGPGQIVPGSGAEEMAAAAEMDPEQRQQMIVGMVEGLAERLKKDGGDFEGWMRLVRAYTVLGERDKARVAASDARRAMERDADKLRRLDALVKELGLES
jgi:cytochrome c-type biogenesis protein CcmH